MGKYLTIILAVIAILATTLSPTFGQKIFNEDKLYSTWKFALLNARGNEYKILYLFISATCKSVIHYKEAGKMPPVSKYISISNADSSRQRRLSVEAARLVSQSQESVLKSEAAYGANQSVVPIVLACKRLERESLIQ